jgi:ParB-like chromosome segregation protein Spo0J
MMKRKMFEIARIYVPVKRRATLEPAKVEALAQSILEQGLQHPILVRPDGAA